MAEDSNQGSWTRGSKTRREVLHGAAAAAVAGGILAACGSDDNKASVTTKPGTTAPGTTGDGATAAPTTVGGATTAPVDSTAGPTGAISRGGTLRVGVGSGSSKETQDAHTMTTDPELAWGLNMYEPLAGLSPTGEFINILAESIEAKSASEFIIRLKPDIEFHNGKTVTADDLISTIKRIADAGLGTRGSGGMAGIDMASMTKLDDLSVRIPLTTPNVAFSQLIGQYFNGIVPTDYDPSKPVGTGPYKFDSFTPGSGATLVRFENHRDVASVMNDRVEITEFADVSARVNALLGDQVDCVGGIPGAQVPTIEATPGLKVLNASTGLFININMRIDSPPFDDVRVRQAMRLIVDRQQMVDQALGGYGDIGNDMYSRYDPGYPKDLPQRVQDIEQAKSLLKAAGHSDLQVEFTAVNFYPGMVECAQVLAEQAKLAGVQIKVNTIETGPFLDGYTNWPFAEGYWGGRNYLPQVEQITGKNAAQNETHWKDDEWQKLIDEAVVTIDDAKRNELITAAMTIEHDRGGFIIWGFANILDAYSDKLGGVVTGTLASLGDYGFSRIGFLA